MEAMPKKLILLAVGCPTPVLHRAGGSSEGDLARGVPTSTTKNRPVSGCGTHVVL